MVERFERFSYAISEISKCWHKLTSDEMEKYGLKGTHSVYLLTLAKHPEGVTASQLCDLCSRDKSDVSRMMAIMEEKGLVTKESAYQNMYRAVFKLTESGMDAAERVRASVGLVVDLAGGNLSEEDRAVFYTALDSIACNLRELCRNGLPKQ